MAFNNNIVLAQKYVAELDGVYAAESKSSILDTSNSDLKFINANTVLLPKMELDGLGDYSRNGGFVDGAVNVTWQPYVLTQDRARGFQVDVMDDEESMNIAFGRLAGEFIRTKVTPEIDAYTFSTLFAKVPAANKVTETLGANTDLATSIANAQAIMDDEEVPYEGRILFVSPQGYKTLKGNITRFVENGDRNIDRNVEFYDDMRIITVPQKRFVTAIDLYDGTTSGEEVGGYVADANAKNINYMIVHPSAVRKIAKHVAPRIFAPAQNIRADAYAYQYRIYHDVFVLANKVNGLYASTAV